MPGEQYEGFVELKAGMNSARNPMLLNELQYAAGVNVVARGGLIKTRPSLVSESASMVQGTFQGAGVWSLDSGDRLVYVTDGVVYSMNVDTLATTTIGLELDTTAQCYFEQVDKYMVIQDGTNDAVILEESGGVDQKYSGTSSIPIGYMMVFAQGRLHMVPKVVPNTSENGRPYLISGDILEPLDRTTSLKFTEVEYLSEGGAHGLPAEMGYIGALGVIRNAMTGTGVGQVLAFGRNGVCAFDFSISRTYWKDQALSQVLYFNSGCVSPWGVLNANNDLIYRSHDGLRVVKYTASQTAGQSGSLSNTPLSVEVNNYLKNDGPYLPYVSMALHDNRVLCTAGGTDTRYFQGLISWDVAAGFYSGAQGLGAYDGIWTGDNFAQTLTALRSGVRTAFVIAEGPKLYSVSETAVFDGTTTPIEARIETRSFSFGDIVTQKKLKYAELWITDVPTDTTFELFYRPHGYPLWSSMGTRTLSVPSGSLPQDFRRVRFSIDSSNENCNPVSKEFLHRGTGFQFAIQWTGRATIERARFVAEPLMEAPPEMCDKEGILLTSGASSGSVLDTYSYEI